MQNLSKKLLTATIVLITSVAVLLGVSTPNVKANTNSEFLLTKNNYKQVNGNDFLNHIMFIFNHYGKTDLTYDEMTVYDISIDFVVDSNFRIFINDEDDDWIEIEFNPEHSDYEDITLHIDKRTAKITSWNLDNQPNNWSLVVRSLVNERPAISGEHTVINNIDSPYSLERIKQIAELKAVDAYYGDLTDDIEVIRDIYTANKSKVGTFEIEYEVTNASGLSTNFVLLVSNKDLTKPTIQGPGTSSMSYTEEFVLSNLIAQFTVTDNHDTNVKLELESTTHVPGVPGIYVFKFFAKDSSNNIATFNHTLTIVDDVKPTITDTNEGVIQVNWRDNVTNEILLMHLSAHDAIDGDLTSSIQVIENNIKNEVGNYTVKYQVTDSAGNSGLYTRTYKVVTTDAPVFWVSANLLLISEVNALTNQQLADELASYEGINMASHMMLLNEYEGNENTPGTYMVRMAINDTHGEEHIVERTIEVFADDELPELELSFWKKAWNVVVSVWEFIVKVFTWIWNAIKWIFDFVFGWIN